MSDPIQPNRHRPNPPSGPQAGPAHGPAVCDLRLDRTGRPRPTRRIAACAAALSGLLWGGCASLTDVSAPQAPGPGPVYQPTNFFWAGPALPAYLRRVAVLPLSVPERDWEAEAGREALREVLLAELGKAQRFELVAVSPDQMRDLTGRPAVRPEEPIPQDLIRRLRQQAGCDGALFAHVQPYRAYPPLKLGWNLKLADLHSRQIIWAADEVFDASEASVARAAWQYARQHGAGPQEASLVLTAPRRFAQYTLAALFARLPRH